MTNVCFGVTCHCHSSTSHLTIIHGDSERRHSGTRDVVPNNATIPTSPPDETLTAAPQIPSPTTHCYPKFSHSSPSDLILRLYFDPPSPSSQEDVELSLHSDVLRRSNYFSTLFSHRWQKPDSSSGEGFRLNLGVSSSRYESFDDHVKFLHLLCTNDFDKSIKSVSTALSILHIARELLFEESVTDCVRFIEAVAWTAEEEEMVMDVIPLLKEEESRELLTRRKYSEKMLHGMILAAITDSKWNEDLRQRSLIEKLLRDFSSKYFVGRALSRAFDTKLSELKKSLRYYFNVFK